MTEPESRLVQIIKKYGLFLNETPEGAEDIEWLVREVERLRFNMGNWETEHARAEEAENMRDNWKYKFDSLSWQVKHKGCVKGFYGEAPSYRCGVCTLCVYAGKKKGES